MAVPGGSDTGSAERWTIATAVPRTAAVAVPRSTTSEQLGRHRVSPPLAGPSPFSSCSSSSLGGSAGSEPTPAVAPLHSASPPPGSSSGSPRLRPIVQTKKRSTIHLISGISGSDPSATAATDSSSTTETPTPSTTTTTATTLAPVPQKWKTATKRNPDAILTTASDGRKHRRANRMSIMRIPGIPRPSPSTPTLSRASPSPPLQSTTATATTTMTTATLRGAQRKGLLGALKTLMHMYPLLPEVPTSVILEFGAVRKRLTAPAKAFRTPEEFRAWAVQNCGSAQGTVLQASPIRIEIYDEATSGFALFCDLQTVIDDAWFRLTIVRDEDSATTETPSSDTAAATATAVAPAESPAPQQPSSGTFAAISKSELLFTDGETTLMPVQQEVTESFTVTSIAQTPVAFAVASLADESPKFKLTFRPADGGHLRPGETATVTVCLTATCTTNINFDIAVTVECPGLDERQVTTLVISAKTHPTSRLDYDEIKLQHPSVGSGASGTVYRGTYRGQEIACKVMLMQDDIEMFEREVESIEQLRSPYIVAFIGASHLPKKLSIVTEFLTLGSVLSAMQRKKFSWPLKLKCLLDCARGMCFLHSSGIMHRDLKPDNLMMATMSFDSPVCCKLCDFGSTRAIGSISLGVKTGGVGTPIYMAPEVLDSKPYNSSADVYSYAMIIWYFCNEYQPYTKGDDFPTPWAISDFVLRGRRLPLPENAPPSLQSLIARCWEQIPSKRPNFSAIAEFVQTLLRGAIDEHQRERQARKAAASVASSTTQP